MCSNLLVRHYSLSCLCLYRLALRKNKYISRSATPIYSVFEAISKRRFLHRKKEDTSAAEITRSSKRRFLHTRKGKFLFHSPLPLCILSQFKRWRFPLLAQREVSTPEKSAIALSTYVCTAMHSCYRKSEISTLHNL